MYVLFNQKTWQFSYILILDKVVSMSSVYSASYSSYKATDGIYLPSDAGLRDLDSLTHTLRELSPWIQIDLAINCFVDGVKIWDRSESTESCELIQLFTKTQVNC